MDAAVSNLGLDLELPPLVLPQATLDESVSEEGVRKRKRRGSTAGVQYSEDVSDAAFNRLIQADPSSEESVSEVLLTASINCRSKPQLAPISCDRPACCGCWF